jgi:predicted nucleic acid-binding protein
MPDKAIADTSTLLALDKIGVSQLLCDLYSEIILPEAVVNEYGTPNLSCVSIRQVRSHLMNLLRQDLNLGRGESEVIALGVETGTRVIIDDAKARKVAESLGLKVVGTIGILIKAESLGLIASAYQESLKLQRKGFYVSNNVIEELSGWKR